MSIVRQCLLAALVLLIASPTRAWSAEALVQTGRGLVEVDGKIKKNEVMEVRARALRQAQQQAVWKAILALGIDDAVQERKTRIEDEVLPAASAFVSSVEVVEEIPGDASYEIVARVSVDRARLVAELASVGITPDVASSRMSVAIVIEEYFKADEAPEAQRVARDLHVVDVSSERGGSYDFDASASERVDARASASGSASLSASGRGGSGSASGRYNESASVSGSSQASVSEHAAAYESDRAFAMSLVEYFPPEQLRQEIPDPFSGAAIGKELLRSDVRLVEGGAVRDMRQALASGGSVVGTLADTSRLGGDAVAFGQKYGADTLLVGVTTVAYDGAVDGAHRATASLAVRVVDTATGDVLASTSRTQSALAADATSSASTAARRVGEIVGEDVRTQLVDYWKQRAERGWELAVQLFGGATASDGYAVERVLSAVPGVMRVEQRFADATSGVVELVVTTKASPRTLRSGLSDALHRDTSTSAFVEETGAGGLWRLRVR